MSDLQGENLVYKTKETYDGSLTADILEQYKMYVQSAENVSSRRIATSRYLLTLSAALLVAYGIQLPGLNQGYWTLTVPVAGIAVSILWYRLIQSHRNLNTVKFQIIHKLEERLPVALYKHEWQMAGQRRDRSYTEATRIEMLLPILFVCLHGLAFILMLVSTDIVVGIFL